MLSFQGAWQQMAKTGRADQVRIVRPVELTARRKDLWDLNKLPPLLSIYIEKVRFSTLIGHPLFPLYPPAVHNAYQKSREAYLRRLWQQDDGSATKEMSLFSTVYYKGIIEPTEKATGNRPGDERIQRSDNNADGTCLGVIAWIQRGQNSKPGPAVRR